MPDQNDDASKSRSAQNADTQRGEKKQSDNAPAGSQDTGNEQQATTSRPRGKTEDPDRTL
jgi:hypothetical protein